MNLTLAEEKILVKLLEKVEPGFLPYEIFKQIARIIALPIIEFVPLRLNDREVEVLLLHRAKNDDIWPGMLHVPGTVVRASDSQDIQKAFDRILHDELGDVTAGRPSFVGNIFHNSKRGAELAQVYWLEVKDMPKFGRFYSSQNLPDNLIDSQREFIQLAVNSYKSYSLAQSRSIVSIRA